MSDIMRAEETLTCGQLQPGVVAAAKTTLYVYCRDNSIGDDEKRRLAEALGLVTPEDGRGDV